MLTLDWNIVWTIINLIVLYLLLQKFLFKPVNALMEKRSQSIEASLNDAKAKNEQAEQLKSQYEASIQNAHSKAAEVIKEAKKMAAEEYEQTMKTAKEDALRLLEQADKNIKVEKAKAMREIQSEIADIAIAAAFKATAESMDEDVNKKLIDDFLVEAGVGQ